MFAFWSSFVGTKVVPIVQVFVKVAQVPSAVVLAGAVTPAAGRRFLTLPMGFPFMAATTGRHFILLWGLKPSGLNLADNFPVLRIKHLMSPFQKMKIPAIRVLANAMTLPERFDRT